MKKIILYISTLIMFLNTGCEKFIDVNQNPNSPTDVQESLILAPLEVAISHKLYSGYAAVLSLHYTQAVALNQTLPNDGTYFLVNSQMNDEWSNLYTTCMNNLKILNDKAEKNGNSNYAAIAKILTAFSLGTGTDLWGDIPYSQALKGVGQLTPVYDKQEDIYKNIQTLLDNGISDIAKNHTRIPGGDDYIYHGDMSKWKRLAYTLKARYYMHLTKAPGYTAGTQADLALAALKNGMSSNDDDFKFGYSGAASNENPWNQTFLPGSTLVLSSYTVETLKQRNDPRLAIMVKPATSPDPVSGQYNGRIIGTNDIGSLESYSIAGDFYAGAGAFNYIFNYSEALFLKAEATLIKSGFSAAQSVYQDAVKSHMQKLGVNSGDITAYLLSRGDLTADNALQKIMEEKNTADFLSVENFTDWRRTGFPVLKKVPNALVSEVPRRFLYPEVEMISNPQPQQTSKLIDRVWWDKQ
ncbi:Starch-binding associating with outer membrane [Pseudarcicella hirudinis]|uniref:Starch-binding associating with outer membrane n=1 Tax=Pseudarcicella hirudinis TaxID=1079859 RepID=A0A1I5UQT6_9BACT|nr:SusD/RagB family nutrient-binding outer membrane lipoprotein [Pseudarcicella hirudinis]SFP97582.1 Starch-binding associating with outer membrane [Pseudarcicella hirudinis]